MKVQERAVWMNMQLLTPLWFPLRLQTLPTGLGQGVRAQYPSCQGRAACEGRWVGWGAEGGYRCRWSPASSLVSALS